MRLQARPTFRAGASVHFAELRGGRGGSPRAGAVRPRPEQLPPARPRRGAPLGQRRRLALDPRARLRVGRPRARSRGSPARSRSAASTAAAAGRGARLRRGSACGARPSCAGRTSATPCPSSASSTRRSRPRSPGIASGSSTTACSRRSATRWTSECGGGAALLPLRLRLSGRAGALLLGLRAGPAGPSSSSGTRSRPPPPRRSSRSAARSPITTRWARPRALVPARGTRPVPRGARRGQGRARPGRDREARRPARASRLSRSRRDAPSVSDAWGVEGAEAMVPHAVSRGRAASSRRRPIRRRRRPPDDVAVAPAWRRRPHCRTCSPGARLGRWTGAGLRWPGLPRDLRRRRRCRPAARDAEVGLDGSPGRGAPRQPHGAGIAKSTPSLPPERWRPGR